MNKMNAILTIVKHIADTTNTQIRVFVKSFETFRFTKFKERSNCSSTNYYHQTLLKCFFIRLTIIETIAKQW